ncbi:MAG: copper resistance protein CopC [Anaerolineae bacterium]|nr:copper resistance protein CopC [Anaerolineae bacterium]
MLRRWIVMMLSLAMLLVVSGRALGHANQEAASPPPNAVLGVSPAEIRMRFTEPLEAQFSRILLRDANGTILELSPSVVDAVNPTEMLLIPGDLPDGLYTVDWRALSAADGHPSQGTYAFFIGDAPAGFGQSDVVRENVPLDGSLIRGANLLSLALLLGGLAFGMFVWRPSVSQPQLRVERRMAALVGVGWLAVAVTGVLLLLLQHALATGYPLLSNIDGDSLNRLVSDTRFGQLWLIRMALWAGTGAALWFARGDRWFNWVALGLGAALLLTNSLFSHANAAYDSTAAIAADWLHLAAMVLWVGGLFQFVNVITALRGSKQSSAPTLSTLVAHFTNFARVAVIALFVTGVFASWLQIGSPEGLLTTIYGQAMLVKLLLIVPVIAIAAVNMIYTHRGLAAGDEVWSGRLRALVGAEIALTVGVLLAVGVMTSISPARSTLALRAANPPQPEPQPIIETLTANDITMELSIEPGWVGENTFTLRMKDAEGQPVVNSTLIRMRFESQEQNLGESELRPLPLHQGVYTIKGANLSLPGEWRIRVTVQRPDAFDALADFKPDVPPMPDTPDPVPMPAPNTPLPGRVLVLVILGIAAMAVGGYFLGENRLRLRASTLLSVSTILIGLLFLASALSSGTAASAEADAPTEPGAYQPPPDAPIRIATNQGIAWPYLVTGAGGLFQAGADGLYRRMTLDGAVRDVYVDVYKTIWAAADTGIYSYKDDAWTQISDQGAHRLELMHGYLFALGDGYIVRIPAGGTELEAPRILDVPDPDAPIGDFLMLGNHDHVIDNGQKLYFTPDLGLSWQPIETPAPIEVIGINSEDQLLATNPEALLTWNYVGEEWSGPLPLPGDYAKPLLRPFKDENYAIAQGRLYRMEAQGWVLVELPEMGAYHLSWMAFQYPDTLWLLDSLGRRLWSSSDGRAWKVSTIQLG